MKHTLILSVLTLISLILAVGLMVSSFTTYAKGSYTASEMQNLFIWKILCFAVPIAIFQLAICFFVMKKQFKRAAKKETTEEV